MPATLYALLRHIFMITHQLGLQVAGEQPEAQRENRPLACGHGRGRQWRRD